MSRLSALLLGIVLASTAFGAEPPPDILKTDLMVVVAHPDDEGMAAATMARYALGEGKVVASVQATRGEGGGNEVGTQLGPALGQLREAELRDVLGRMGVRHLYFLDKTDWAYTESAAATLQKWGHDDSLGKLVRIVRNLRPEVVVTFLPAPTGGQHGHHQTAGLLATEAFDAAADPSAFPEQIKKEGLRPWQVKRLFYAGEHAGGKHVAVAVDGKAGDGRIFAEIASEAESHHLSQGFGGFGAFRGPARPQNFTLVKTALPPDSLNGDDLLSGLDGTHGILAELEPDSYRIAPGGTARLRVSVSYHGDLEKVQPGPPGTPPEPVGLPDVGGLKPIHFDLKPELGEGWKAASYLPLDSGLLFDPSRRGLRAFVIHAPDNLDLKSDIPIRVRLKCLFPNGTVQEEILQTSLAPAPLVEAEVVPLPAIARYRNWTRTQHIERFAGVLPSWVPMAGGQPGAVRVALVNHDGKERSLNVRPQLPTGWTCSPETAPAVLPARGDKTLEFTVTPPPNAIVADVPFTVSITDGTGAGAKEITSARAIAQVTPFAEVPKLSTPPAIDGDLSDWSGSEIRVPSANLVQGQFKDDADGSVTAHLAYDDRYLYVGARVRDEVVVSNIAPDDIKAHWRTDSVELTVDPKPRSESTLTTFKVGIFPWDTAGRVRAARDADADQGPIEETAPDMKLASRHTPDGYVLEVALPWSSIGAKPRSGERLGFNLLLYDGDKKDARVGDGIGEGRLAWSPRPGVWGRAEQWGEIRLQ